MTNLTRTILATCLAVIIFLLPDTAIATHGITPDDHRCMAAGDTGVITTAQLTVLTLNMAHGRKDAFNQMFQKTSTTRRNLEEITSFLDNSRADLIALQEADSPSRWSGKFNHVDFVSEKSTYPCRLHAHHAHSYMYDFGTALLSRVPYVEKLSHTFEPSPPTTNKGFVMGKVRWNPGGRLQQPVIVSVISVHLDFSRKKVREAQTEEMRIMLAGVSPPVIILGDFNTDWSKDESVLRAIASNSNLNVYQPEATGLGTYKSGKHRLDWILISKDLEFVSYEVPQVVLSDHLPVRARIRLLENPVEASNSSISENDTIISHRSSKSEKADQ